MNVRKLSRLVFLLVTALVLTMTPRAFADPIDPADLLFPGGTITVDPSDYALTIPPSDAVAEVGTTIAISGPRDASTGVEDEGAFDLTPCVSGLSEKRAINYFAATTAECNALDRMEQSATDEYIASHGLRDDRDYARAAARNDIRASLWVAILRSLQLNEADRTPDQQIVADWFKKVVQRYQVGIAQSTKDEFDAFDAPGKIVVKNGVKEVTKPGLCTYKPPAPYADEFPDSVTPLPSKCYTQSAFEGLFGIEPEYPTQEQFVRWGTARALDGLPADTAATVTTQVSSSLIGQIAAGAGGALVTQSLAALVKASPALTKALVDRIFPYAVESLLRAAASAATKAGTKVAEVTAAQLARSIASSVTGPVIGIIVTAVITIIFTAIEFATKQNLRTNFADAVDTAASFNPTMSDYVNEPGAVSALFSLFSYWQALQFGDDPATPAPVERTREDGAFVVDGIRTDRIVAEGWDGERHTTVLRGGYFVTDGVVSSTLWYVDPNGTHRVLYRVKTPTGWAFSSVAAEGEHDQCDGSAGSACETAETVQMRSTAFDARPITVGFAENAAPTLDVSVPSSARTDEPVTLAATATDPDGDPLTTTWWVQRRTYSVDGELIDPCSTAGVEPIPGTTSCYVKVGSSPTVSTSFPVGGLTYKVKAETTDGVGQPVRVIREIAVENVAPTVALAGACSPSAGPNGPACTALSTTAGGSVRLGGTVTDPDDTDPVQLTIDWGNGEVVTSTYPCEGSACNPDVTWKRSGDRRTFSVFRAAAGLPTNGTVTVRATDGLIFRVPATAAASYNVTPPTPQVVLPNVTPSVPEGSALEVSGRVTGLAAAAPVTVELRWEADGSTTSATFPCPDAGCDPAVSFEQVDDGVRFTVRRTFAQDGLGGYRVVARSQGIESAVATGAYLVTDVAPSISFSVDDCVVGSAAGRCVVQQGERVVVRGQVRDPGVEDAFVAEVVDGSSPDQDPIEFVRVDGGYDFVTSFRAARVSGLQRLGVRLRDTRIPVGSVTYSAEQLFEVPALPGSAPVVNAAAIADLVTGIQPHGQTNADEISVSTAATASGGATIEQVRIFLDEGEGTDLPPGGVPVTGVGGSAEASGTTTIDISALDPSSVHYLIVQAVDSFGRASRSVTTRFYIDRTPPTFDPASQGSVSLFQPDQLTRDNFPFAVIPRDDLGLKSASCTRTSPMTLVDGRNPVSCVAEDFSGNKTGYAFVVSVSEFPAGDPNIFSPTLAPAKVLSASSNSVVAQYGLDWDDADGTTLTSVEAWIDDEDPVQIDGPFTTLPDQLLTHVFDVSGLTDGDHTISLRATDSRNRSSTKKIPLVVDRIGPSLVVEKDPLVVTTLDPLGAIVDFSSNVTASISGTPVTPTCTPVSGSRFSYGDTTVSCSVTDRQDRTASARFVVRVEEVSKAPELTVLGSTTATKGASVDAFLGLRAFGPQVGIASYGLRVPGPNGSTITSAVTGGGVKSFVSAYAGLDVSALGDGVHTVTAFVKDTLDRETTKTFTVIIDRTGPTFGATGPLFYSSSDGGPLSNLNYPKPSASDRGNVPTDVTCTPAPGSTFPLGDTTITCTSSDVLGNTSEVNFVLTVEPPAGDPTITVDPIGTPTKAGTVPINATVATTATGATVASVKAFLESTAGTPTPIAGANGAARGTASGVLNISGASDGTHFAIVVVTDSYGHTGTAIRSFRVDRTAPALTVPSALAVAATSDEGAVVTFTTSASDSGDGGAVDVTCDRSSGEQFPVGRTTVTCRASDRSGNETTKDFVVDVAPFGSDPEITLGASARFTNAGSLVVSAIAKATTPGASITRISGWIDAISGPGVAFVGPFPGSPVSASATFALSQLPEGDHRLILRAADSSGRSLTIDTVFTIDRTAPTLSPSILTMPIRWRANGVVAIPNARDAGSGVASSSCAPVATGTAGRNQVACTAIDQAGNRRTVNLPYTVEYSLRPQVAATPWKVGFPKVVYVRLADVNGAVITDETGRQLAKDCRVTAQLTGAQSGGRACMAYDPINNRFFAALGTVRTGAVGPGGVVFRGTYSGVSTVTTTTASVSFIR